MRSWAPFCTARARAIPSLPRSCCAAGWRWEGWPAVGRAGPNRSLPIGHYRPPSWELSGSGRRERGIAYALQAAERALQHSALEEAHRHYQMARALLDRTDGRYGDVLRRVGEAALLAGKEDEAVSTLAEAQALLLAASD